MLTFSFQCLYFLFLFLFYVREAADAVKTLKHELVTEDDRELRQVDYRPEEKLKKPEKDAAFLAGSTNMGIVAIPASLSIATAFFWEQQQRDRIGF